ncbi:hypothetical protein LCGC14_2324310 [marine sediment metagenome]|uniref:DUF5681 domain-containing protein n=1 Tax=marine sediment metagenome TaxID=412755 RepID=A0A0F9FBN3_9ZZZZ
MVEQQVITRDKNGRFLPGVVPEKSTPFRPGEVHNPAGRPKNSVTTLLKNRSREDNKKIADKLYQLALDGDMSAIREYIDRTDGKVSFEPEALIDNRSITINVVSDTAKKLLSEITEGVKPHKEG